MLCTVTRTFCSSSYVYSALVQGATLYGFRHSWVGEYPRGGTKKYYIVLYRYSHNNHSTTSQVKYPFFAAPDIWSGITATVYGTDQLKKNNMGTKTGCNEIFELGHFFCP